MNILVCIKQVPDTSEVKIDKETNTLIREGIPSIINPFDLHAIEEGVRLKTAHGGKVTVMTMGPPQAEEALKESIALGADEVILLSDRAFAGADTWATSLTLAAAIRKMDPVDIIICGRQAIDGDTAQVGPGIAEHLSIGHITSVRKISWEAESGFTVERLTDDGHEVLTGKSPLLVSVVREINQPRMPSMKGLMKAKKTQIPVWNHEYLELAPETIGLQGSPTWVTKIFTPTLPESNGEMYSGNTDECVDHLMSILGTLKVV
jgi:electron transfer flavoprotein beta subunit